MSADTGQQFVFAFMQYFVNACGDAFSMKQSFDRVLDGRKTHEEAEYNCFV